MCFVTWPGYSLAGSYVTFSEVFASHGYATADFGKLHIPRQLRRAIDERLR